jgi:hypothetical protein
VLDLFFTNNEELLRDFEIMPTTAEISDHNIIDIETNFKELNTRCVNVRCNEEVKLSDLNFFSEQVNWEAMQT